MQQKEEKSYLLEIINYKYGTYKKRENEKTYLSFFCKNMKGKNIKCAAFGNTADMIHNEIQELSIDGNVENLNIVIEIKGNIQQGKQIIKNNKPLFSDTGNPIYEKTLFVNKYEILKGPVLELARLRKKAFEVVQNISDILGDDLDNILKDNDNKLNKAFTTAFNYVDLISSNSITRTNESKVIEKKEDLITTTLPLTFDELRKELNENPISHEPNNFFDIEESKNKNEYNPFDSLEENIF